MRLPFLLLPFLLLPCIAQGQHRCVDNGRVLITDQPCLGQGTPSGQVRAPSFNKALEQELRSVSVNARQGYDSPYGGWRGQVQFQRSINGQQVAEAHMVTPVTLEIDPQGKITGVNPDAGCRIKGVASPGFTPTMLNVDITLSSCQQKEFNRRLAGTLVLSTSQKYVSFSVQGTYIVPYAPGQYFEVKGALRR